MGAMSDQNLPEDNAQNSSQPNLPLEELTLTPGWVKSTSDRSFRDHQGESRDARFNKIGRRSGHPGDCEKPRSKRGSDGNREFSRKSHAIGKKGDRSIGGSKAKPHPQRDPQKRNERPRFNIDRVEPAPLEVSFYAEEKAFESLAAKMKESTFAYSFFDVAKLILNKADRHQIFVRRKPAEDGSREPLYWVLGSECVFLSEQDARNAVFRRHRNLFCKVSKVDVEPPKGSFTFVNKCGFTGTVLGPPNYHDYQSRLVRHHQRHLAHVPFEKFRARIETVKDPDAVKTWMDSMSVQTFYGCLHCNPSPSQVPASEENIATDVTEVSTQQETTHDAPKFATAEELENHITENHLSKIIETRQDVTISGVASRNQDDRSVREAIYQAWQSERRFPLKTANQMQGKLRQAGFHFFKDNKGITYVSPIKLKRFEAGQVLTEEVQKIVIYVRAHRGCTRKQLVAGLLGNPEQKATEEKESPLPHQTNDGLAVDASQTQEQTTPSTPSPQGEADGAVTDASTQGEPSVSKISPTDQVLANLHWLIQDGYVVEFSSGKLWVPEEKKPQAPPAASKSEEKEKKTDEKQVGAESSKSKSEVDQPLEGEGTIQVQVPPDSDTIEPVETDQIAVSEPEPKTDSDEESLEKKAVVDAKTEPIPPATQSEDAPAKASE